MDSPLQSKLTGRGGFSSFRTRYAQVRYNPEKRHFSLPSVTLQGFATVKARTHTFFLRMLAGFHLPTDPYAFRYLASDRNEIVFYVIQRSNTSPSDLWSYGLLIYLADFIEVGIPNSFTFRVGPIKFSHMNLALRRW